jgi:hypothetical protein
MRISIFLSLFVFSFQSAFAQSAATDEPLSLRQRFLAVVDSASCAESPTLPDTQKWQPFDLPTIGVQTLYGAIGAGIFTAFGVGIMQGGGGFDELGAGIVVMFLGGSLVGIPLGVLYGGDVMGGEASSSAVFTGSALGTTAGILAFLNMDYRSATAVYIAAAFAGPILGYHLSAGSPADRIREGSAIPPSRLSLGGAVHSPNPRCLMNAANPTIPRPEIEMTVLALRF